MLVVRLLVGTALRAFAHPTKSFRQVSSVDWTMLHTAESLHRELHLFARLQAVVRAQSIEHAEALERMV